MDLLLVFSVFVLCMIGSLLLHCSMLLPLCIGFLLFAGLAVKRGFSPKSVLSFAVSGLKDALVVIVILLLIGCLTGLWRLSGTVTYFVSLGISLIPPQLFLLAAFLLSALMSFALGTSFGVASTAGVILLGIARIGGADPILTAGAVLSGIYVGDRGSPAASSANLVAILTHTDMRNNVRDMARCALVPFLLCCILYAIFSFVTPIQHMDATVVTALANEFSLSWYCILPAALMLILPFCGVKIRLSMIVSLICALLVAILVQHENVMFCIQAMLLGFTPKDPSLTSFLSGGGVVSMLEICGILLLSCSYGGIFQQTGMLLPLEKKLSAAANRIGRYPVMLLLSLCVSALFCNQTISAIMQNQLSTSLYGKTKEESRSKMLDMENSVILIAGLVPWCIACSVPLAMLGASPAAIPFGFYLWLLPLYWLIRSCIQRKKDSKA